MQAFKYINHLKEIGIGINFFYEKILFEYHKAHYKVLQKQNGAIEEMKKHAQTLADYGFLLEAKALFEEIERLWPFGIYSKTFSQNFQSAKIVLSVKIIILIDKYNHFER